LWFFILSQRSARGCGKFSENTLLRLEHGSGIVLLVLALIHGVLIIIKMNNHSPHP
jgi:hypothetical protein